MTVLPSPDHSMLSSKFKDYKTSITKVMEADEFLRLVADNPDRIKSSRIILPRLGSEGLGKFLVELEY